MADLARRLGVRDAVLIGLGSMLGAGVFAVFSPAAASAGDHLLWALLIAAAVAYLNAISSARLAAVLPFSGGTYVYGRERLGPFWGYLAGWAFVVGKVASCAAMALTVGSYLWPGAEVPVAALSVAALTALNYRGIHRSATATRIIVAIVLVGLLAVVLALWLAPPSPGETTPTGSAPGVLGTVQGAGFFFFAFAGYARIATLGEEVTEPERTIPRAIPVALGLVLLVYGAVTVSLLHSLGAEWVAGRSAPVAEAVEISGWPWLGGPVRVVAAIAALGALLALILGVSRTVLAMARDSHLPTPLAAVHPRFAVPHRAELVVGVVVIAVVVATDLRGAIGFSSFCVLVYYAIANASAWTLGGGPVVRAGPVLGVVGCLTVAATLPGSAVLAGLVVIVLGVGTWFLGRAVRREVRRRAVDT